MSASQIKDQTHTKGGQSFGCLAQACLCGLPGGIAAQNRKLSCRELSVGFLGMQGGWLATSQSPASGLAVSHTRFDTTLRSTFPPTRDLSEFSKNRKFNEHGRSFSQFESPFSFQTQVGLTKGSYGLIVSGFFKYLWP